MHAYSHPYEHIHKSYPYEHLRKLSRQILEIDKVTIGDSLSTGTSPTTKYTTPLNPRTFALKGSRTQTSGATEALVTTRLQTLFVFLVIFGLENQILLVHSHSRLVMKIEAFS